MPAYRLFRFDSLGHIKGSEVLEAHSDAAAIELAGISLGGESGELWRGETMISQLGQRLHNPSR